jgi:hypothetical protein
LFKVKLPRVAIAILLDEIGDESSENVQHPLVLLLALELEGRPMADGRDRLGRHRLDGLWEEFQRRGHYVNVRLFFENDARLS